MKIVWYDYIILNCPQLAYQLRYEPRPLHSSRLDGLKEVDHSFSFQSLQLSMDANECTSTTNAITVSHFVCACQVKKKV